MGFRIKVGEERGIEYHDFGVENSKKCDGNWRGNAGGDGEFWARFVGWVHSNGELWKLAKD